MALPVHRAVTAPPQPNHRQELQEFHRWLRDCTVTREIISGDEKTTDGQFIPETAVRSKFKADNLTFVRSLCDAVLPSENLRVYAAEIAENCATVFCILLALDKGQFILQFLHNADLHDSRLPFVVCPEEFPIVDDEFFDEFWRKQWEFCAPVMKSTNEVKFKDDRILPFITRERIAEGGSATIDKVYIHEGYDQLYRKTEQGKILSPDHCYALKTYDGPHAKEYYEREVSAFRRLLENASTYPSPFMIGFHGSFTHKGTFNVLLEYADGGTLEDFFEKVQPPKNARDIIAFWESLLQVPKAMFRLHEQSLHENDPQCRAILQGWHQDIKPANILVIRNSNVSPYCWTFKLADLGLSHFKAVSSGAAEAGDLDTFGTRTYGAPECYGWSEFTERARQHVKRSTDIWSFGCVCSEAAVWVVNGVKGDDGLEDFRQQRMQDVDKIEGFRGGNCFHNGKRLRASVLNMHGRLRDNIRASDHITSRVLSRIVEPTLRAGPETRPQAKMLDYEAEQAVESAKGYLTTNRGVNSAPPQGPSQAIFPRPSEDSQSSRGSHVQRRSDGSQKSATGSFFPDEHRKFQSPRQTGFSEREFHEEVVPRRSTVQSTDDHSYGRRKLPLRGLGMEQQIPELVESGYSTPHRSNTERLKDRMRPVSGSAHGMIDENSQLGSPVQKKKSVRYEPPTHEGVLAETFSAPPSRGRQVPGRQDILRLSAGSQDDDPFHPNPQNDVSRDEQYARELQAQYDSNQRGLQQGYGYTQHDSGAKEDPGNPLSQKQYYSSKNPRAKTRVIYRQPIPELSVANAIYYRRSRRQQALDNGEYQWHLNARDHLFLVDDSAFMAPHWRELEALLDALAYITKDCDDDGVELFFMNDRRSVKSKNASNLVDLLKKVVPKGAVDARVRLGEILNRYQGKITAIPAPKAKSKLSFLKPKLFKNTDSLRPLSIYVLTAGVWQPGCELDGVIASLVNKLVECNVPTSPIGIEFIRFGHHAEGKLRLERLDDDLGLDLDIIDTEPSNGNVWKMLLGSINTWFDEAESAREPSPNSAYGHARTAS